MKAAKQEELEAFWHSHLDGWQRGRLSETSIPGLERIRQRRSIAMKLKQAA